MRDLIIFGVIFGILPFALYRPVIGVFLFTWVSLMNPHRLTYGSAYDFPFAAVIVVITILGLIISRQPKQFPTTPLTVVLILFMVWMTLTSFFALEPGLVWIEWNRVIKTLFMVLITIYAINTEKDIKLFAWVIVLSLAFYGFKGGIFTIVSGGKSLVMGPPDSYIGENNGLALALITVLPIIWYLKLQSSNKWLTMALTGLAVLTLVAAAGTYSRGAMLAGSGMLFFLWLKGQHKFRVGLALILVIPLIYTVMPDKWFERMETIDNYQTDDSALGRINAWGFATNVATSNLLGGGYSVFTPKMFHYYAPVPQDYHAAHSIYFQVLGEHGFVGLALFLLLMLLTWRTGSRIIKNCRDKVELKWAADLAAMSQVSIIGYAIAGAFLSLAYYDLYYNIMILLVLLEKIVLNKTTDINIRKLPAQ